MVKKCPLIWAFATSGSIDGYAAISLDVTFKEKNYIIINELLNVEVFEDNLNGCKDDLNLKIGKADEYDLPW